MMPTPTQRQIRRDRPLVRRMLLATCLITVGFSAVVWRLYDLHLKRGPALAEMASAKFREVRTLPAQRGSIKDKSGRYLAYDEEIFDLSTNRVHLNEPPTVKLALSKVRKIGVRDLTREMNDAQIIAAYQEHIASVIALKLGVSADEALLKLHSKEQTEVLAEKMNEDQAKEWNKASRRELHQRCVCEIHHPPPLPHGESPRAHRRRCRGGQRRRAWHRKNSGRMNTVAIILRRKFERRW